uniref:DUF6457 domain-containing protein n=1 Tax=Streptomyces sp. CHD11 TaxID=2741325 RepID=UPI0027E59071|nr:DUF6457 domain-containing protein [Streptomyces sp. CHD11]
MTTNERTGVMDDVPHVWTAAPKAALGIEPEADRALLLALAGDAAHGVALPAAPLTAFLVGYAAGQGAGPKRWQTRPERPSTRPPPRPADDVG